MFIYFKRDGDCGGKEAQWGKFWKNMQCLKCKKSMGYSRRINDTNLFIFKVSWITTIT